MNKNKRQRWIRLALLAASMLALAAVLWPNFVRCHCPGTLTACKSNLKNLGTAMEMYSTDFSGKYPDSLEQLYPDYLKTEPICPKAKHSTYRASYGKRAPFNDGGYEDYYLVECTGENHSEVDYPPDFPKYNGIIGLIERPRDGVNSEQRYVHLRSGGK